MFNTRNKYSILNYNTYNFNKLGFIIGIRLPRIVVI